LYTDGLTEGTVAVTTQAKVHEQPVFPANVGLHIHAVVHHLIVYLITCLGCGVRDVARPVPDVGAVVSHLTVLIAEELPAYGRHERKVPYFSPVLTVQLQRKSPVFPFPVADAAAVGRQVTGGVREVLIRLDVLVTQYPEVQATQWFQLQVLQRLVLKTLRGLEAVDHYLVILQALSLPHIFPHAGKLFLAQFIDARIEPRLWTRHRRGTALGEPQARVAPLIPISVAFILIVHKAEAALIYQL